MSLFFFFNDTATTEIYTLSLHDALPILHRHMALGHRLQSLGDLGGVPVQDRKSTRLNSSHVRSSYAVFCLKKKNTNVGGFSPPAGCLNQSCSGVGRFDC